MAQARHKRDTNARRFPARAVIAGPIAFVATAAVVTVGVLGGESSSSTDRQLTAGPSNSAESAEAAVSSDRIAGLSRSLPRGAKSAGPTVPKDRAAVLLAPAATRAAIAAAETKLWITTDLNLWSSPREGADKVGMLEEGKKVLVTGRKVLGREEVVVSGKARWVTEGYLSEEKPAEPSASPSAEADAATAAGVSDESCPDSGPESGLTDAAVKVYRTVCHAFPSITTYGGWDSHGEHGSGRAIDIMTSDVGLGTEIAEFLRAHADELDLYDVIWRQRIWTPVRASEGWRSMEDRGSATANHYDHVHVSTTH